MNLKAEVVKLKKGNPSMSFSQIGTKLGITKDQARGLYVRAPNVRPPVMNNATEIKISGDVMVVGDVHVPYTDWRLVSLVQEVAENYNIKQIAIVGDMFSFSSLSKWPTVVREPTVAEELKAARAILEFWGTQFDQFYMCMGNHDLRLMGKVQGELGPDNLVDLFRPASVAPERIRVTMLDRMWLKSPKWLLAHQIMYSKAKLNVGQTLSQKYECNVLTHHQHHQAVGISANGKYMIADNGCLCDATKTPYKTLVTNGFPEWCTGFSMFHSGVYHPYWHTKKFGWMGGWTN